MYIRSLRHQGILRAGVCFLAAAVMTLSAIMPAGIGYDNVFAAENEEKHLSVDPTREGDGYSAVLYDNTNGLPTSEANAIAETEEGFIWIGSYSGLIRYDGNTFERMNSTNGIASVVSLYVDSKNRLWVGTNDNGAAVMENGKFTIFNKSNGLQSLSVRSITEDSSGKVYLATTHGMVYVDSELNLVQIDEPQINDEYIRTLELGDNDVIYGITMNNAIFTMKDAAVTGFYDANKLGISNARTLCPDNDNPGYVYVGTTESEIYYGQLNNGFEKVDYNDNGQLFCINDIRIIDDGLWICCDSGIGLRKDGELSFLDSVPMNSSVEDMMVDYQGNVWFVSSQQGVMKIVKNQFSNIFDKYQLEKEVVYSTCILNDQLFIGTKNNGLKILKGGNTLTEYPLEEALYASGEKYESNDLFEILGNAKIRSIIRDSKNRLWFSTFGESGLVMLDGRKATVFTESDGLPSSRIRTVYECEDGTFLVACTGGIAVIKDNKIVDVYNESTGISNTEVLTVIEGVNHETILGTDGDGIYVIKDKKAQHFGTGSGLSSDIVMRVKRDISRDIYWIVTSNSLAYMTKDLEIHTINKFPYSNNFDLYENSSGDMWVLSSNGIYIASVDELLKNEEISTVYYGRDNGLSCIATSNSYSELTKEGNLYISGTTGVSKVNIDTEFENVSNTKMAVPYIEADGELIYPDASGKFVIPSSTKKLTIYSFAYNYSLMNPLVTYHLEGFEKSTTTVKRSDLAPIDYTNLSGGNYSFIMEIQDPQGNGSKTLEVEITKTKAVYEQIWFKIICIIVIIATLGILVMVYINHRTKRFLKKEAEDKQLIREIVETFSKVIDMKDKYTNGHSSRVGKYTAMLAKELGYDDETVEKYYDIALLHDIGKVGVPENVLNKPGKLDDREFAIIKSHSALGYNTLKDISIMPELAIGAGAHHERPDGKGYPKGLKGDEIPRVAQIIAVADTFDAMYSDRPYRKRMNFDKVVSIMKEVRGTQLTEDVVDAFLRLVDKGEFRDPYDNGGGTMEDIDNIRKKFDKEESQNESVDDKNE